MTMRAIVSRPIPIGDDEFGHPLPPEYQPIHTQLPCAFWVASSDRDVKDTQKQAVIGNITGIIPADSDVSEKDVIDQIVDRANRVMFYGPAEVLSVVHRRGHRQIVARPVA